MTAAHLNGSTSPSRKLQLLLGDDATRISGQLQLLSRHTRTWSGPRRRPGSSRRRPSRVACCSAAPACPVATVQGSTRYYQGCMCSDVILHMRRRRKIPRLTGVAVEPGTHTLLNGLSPAPQEADAGRAAHLVRRCNNPVGAEPLHIHRHVGHALATVQQHLGAHLS